MTENSYVKYGTEKNVKAHHGDKFWAKALASSGGEAYDRNKIIRNILKGGIERVFTQRPISPLAIPVFQTVKNTRGYQGTFKSNDPTLDMFFDAALIEG